MAKAAAVTVVPTKEQAVKTALEIERTEAALTQMKAELKAYVEANGALEAGDKKWDFYPSYSWEFVADKLKELAVSITIEGENPWDFLTLPAASIKKLGWDELTLSRYGSKVESSKSFKSKKS